MPGSLFDHLRNAFSRPTPRTLIASTRTGEDRSAEEVVLDPSTGRIVQVPLPPDGNSRSERKPPEYWKLFNAAEAHYQRGWYDQAKAQILELRQFGEPHPTARTLLLRTYRKLVAKEAAKRASSGMALTLYEDMFRECSEDITDTDRREYNRLVDLLPSSSPLQGKPKMPLAGRKQVASFEVLSCPAISIELTHDYPPVGKEIRGRGQWRFAEIVGEGAIYAKPVFFDQETSRYTRTVMLHVAADYQSGTTWNVEGEVWLLATARAAGLVATVSAGLELCLWTASGGLVANRSLTDIASKKYELRSLAVSPNGELLVVTAMDKVRLFDRSLVVNARWRSPMNPGWTRVNGSSAVDSERERLREDLATLGLSEFPSPEELRRAFRQVVLNYHPDRNPDDPKAHEKTKAVIQAYERLGEEDATQAFAGLADAEYYYRVIEQIKVEVPGLGSAITIEMGMTGDPRDWVYAASLSEDGERVYLATYSGKVYSVSSGGVVLRTFDLGTAVRAVRETQDHLVVHSFEHLHVFKGEHSLRQIPVPAGANLAWGDQGFSIWQGKSLRAYTRAGDAGAEVAFKNPIVSALWRNGTLVVDTALKRFVFSTGDGFPARTP